MALSLGIPELSLGGGGSDMSNGSGSDWGKWLDVGSDVIDIAQGFLGGKPPAAAPPTATTGGGLGLDPMMMVLLIGGAIAVVLLLKK